MNVFKVLLFLVMSMSAYADEVREWSSKDGSQTFSAVYIRIVGQDVLLQGADKRQVKVPISKLRVSLVRNHLRQ